MSGLFCLKLQISHKRQLIKHFHRDIKLKIHQSCIKRGGGRVKMKMFLIEAMGLLLQSTDPIINIIKRYSSPTRIGDACISSTPRLGDAKSFLPEIKGMQIGWVDNVVAHRHRHRQRQRQSASKAQYML